MATIASTRIARLQAVSPRTSTVAPGLGTVVDYSILLNKPTLGALAAQDSVNLSSQITGQLAASSVNGLGALALLNSVSLATQVTGQLDATTKVTNLGTLAFANGLAANQIGAGTLAAGVIYAGSVAASQISAGTITASVSISSDGYIKAGGSTSASAIAYSGSVVGETSTAAVDGVLGVATSGSGVHGYATTGNGVWGQCLTSGGVGVKATGAFGATALAVVGPMTIDNKTTVVNLNAEFMNGVKFGTATTGTATATSVLTNKPGSNSSNGWLPVLDTTGATVGYMQIWT